VIHRTFRSLDDRPKLVGFTIRQWALLIAGGILVLAVVHVAHLGAKAAITLCVFTIGLPAALTYVSESGGLQLGMLLRDMVGWRLRAKTLPAAGLRDRPLRGVLIAATREPVGHESVMKPVSCHDEMPAWERWE
jgi:hypothetical protein